MVRAAVSPKRSRAKSPETPSKRPRDDEVELTREAVEPRRQLLADLRRWEALGDHRTGGAGDRATAAWLVDELAEASLAASVDEFPFPRRTPGVCSVSDGVKKVAGVAYADGGATDLRGVAAPASLAAAPGAGGVGVLWGSPVEEDNDAVDAARDAGSFDALVVATRGGLRLRDAESYAEPYGPPVVQVDAKESAWLFATAKAGMRLEVKATVRRDASFTSNVVATVPGADAGLAPVVVACERTAWRAATGEAGGAVALWLACARFLATARPRRTVEFVAAAGREVGHPGLARRLDARDAAAAHCWVLIGPDVAAKGSGVVWQASTRRRRDAGLRALRALGQRDAAAPAEPRGEAAAFVDDGATFVALSGAANGELHGDGDTLARNVDEAKLARLHTMLLTTLLGLAEE